MKDRTIRIKYFDSDMPRLEKIDVGDWIDLRSAEDIFIPAGGLAKIPLGIAMELPEGCEALIVPRGSTYKNYKILQVNTPGVVDESYKGDGDEWFVPMLAMEDTRIPKYSRICQFRIQKKQPHIDFVEVEHLYNPDRGGYGSTGKV